jgi:aspartyl-tRNA synthetase
MATLQKEMVDYTHKSHEINESLQGQRITLNGWVSAIRDHKQDVFLDLRPPSNLSNPSTEIQLTYSKQTAVFQKAEKMHPESVIQVIGVVTRRPEGKANAKIPSGDVEIMVDDLTILNHSAALPFTLDSHTTISELLTLKHRSLFLRKPEVQSRLWQRDHIYRVIRQYAIEHHFVEIETPLLTSTTPEGARDYLVPSRTYPGKCFALPQSPQLFKQMLMMSGVGKYFQFARCFRDEDLRADRQPEFTQLDIEMSFVDASVIQAVIENLLCRLFAEVLQIELPQPFPKLTYAEAMQYYGSDRPDLRIPLKLIDIADLVQHIDFKVFSGPANALKSRVVALRVPNGAHLTRREIEEYTQYVLRQGAKGLAWLKVTEQGIQSPIEKFLPVDVLRSILERTEAKVGDLLFFGADSASIVEQTLGALRIKLGHDLKLLTHAWAPVWIIDFPLFEWDTQTKRWQSLHHPFTAPQDYHHLAQGPESCLAQAYDMVLNGVELGGGSLRIHEENIQLKVFNILGMTAEEAQEKFGFLLEALKFGCPPHGGFAFGLDRLAMIMTGAHSIREVIAFPKTQSAHCPLTDAPSLMDPQRFRELGLQLIAPYPDQKAQNGGAQ